ncbi:hypothetical protein [Azohydromonas sediminis]|uniref:hypothetical protein n=1 Tax=Azohydromonas sediminis TaxID=2259674 RepID=UPI000E65D888|nr:hypothetical protein [Azohydromonas sediminis]
MWRSTLTALALWALAAASHALSPYVYGDRVDGADLSAQLAQVERKLKAQGFAVLGTHRPRGLPQHASVVVADPELLQAVARAGGPAVLGAALRVGVKSDGTVSYVNPGYWARAYLRDGYAAAEPAVRAAQARLERALGTGAGFGGDVPEGDLANYRYMFGMERLDSANSELNAFATFDEALRTVQANLARGVGATAKVYEVVLPQQQLAVFGVALNDADTGEGWWAGKIGADHVAALPYEIYVVGGKVYSPYARYRIALAWPALGMGQFMGIVRAPDAIRDTMLRVAGGSGH